jgi:hypothetical protein
VTLDLYTASVDELGRDAVASLERSLPESATGIGDQVLGD